MLFKSFVLTFNYPEKLRNNYVLQDEVPQVRETILTKLHKGLGRGLPNKCLPQDFLGFYVLSGFEQDKRLRSVARSFMVLDINKRREYAKSLTMGSSGCKYFLN